jgi:hypothetical protein
MRRAKRMSMMVMAAALVTILLASSLPAGAQNGNETCPAGSQILPVDVDGEQGFVCRLGNEFICPEGFVKVLIPDHIIVGFGFCEPAPPDGSGDGSGGGGAGGGSWGAAPLSQEGQQDSEAGEIEQTFNISHTPS